MRRVALLLIVTMLSGCQSGNMCRFYVRQVSPDTSGSHQTTAMSGEGRAGGRIEPAADKTAIPIATMPDNDSREIANPEAG
ncbi:hypothetical protein Sinac_2196 [Singulisphaera acidiphila DSM 18658]|uniref:Lipoprotein n=1 Tax=Singulisphaera acidiphila (strain ATCC BAA-1392 / DSM 18658 / VKM B-2454 / MOB10) TaxID=886293 RepID=L0DCF4_SINAD|nr:hypothetical protein Sinac_2196 [Singulisphaera acidiphila DSM 18658]